MVCKARLRFYSTPCLGNIINTDNIIKLIQVNFGLYFLAAFIFGIGMIAFAYFLSYTGVTPRNAALTVGCVAPICTIAGMILINFKQKDWLKF